MLEYWGIGELDKQNKKILLNPVNPVKKISFKIRIPSEIYLLALKLEPSIICQPFTLVPSYSFETLNPEP